MALAAREREKEREHPTASSVLLRPATRGVARSWSPHEINPTLCPPFSYDPPQNKYVRDAVRRVMAAAGRDPGMFGAHSLRIGGATAALAAGVSPQLIRLMGRWSSDIYEIYCRMSIDGGSAGSDGGTYLVQPT